MKGFHVRASGCFPKSGEGREGLGVVLLMGWYGEWLVEPGFQIAAGKEIYAQSCRQVGGVPGETGGLL